MCVGVRLNSSSGPAAGRQAGEEVGARTRFPIGLGEDRHALRPDGSGQAGWIRLWVSCRQLVLREIPAAGQDRAEQTQIACACQSLLRRPEATSEPAGVLGASGPLRKVPTKQAL